MIVNNDDKCEMVNFNVPKTLQNISDVLHDGHKKYLTVKELAAHHGLNVGAIYSLIKAEPDFPYINTGVKKKFMVDLSQFEIWLDKRTQKQKCEHFKVPSSLDLVSIFKSTRIKNESRNSN